MKSFDYRNQFSEVKKDIAEVFTKALDVQADATGLQLRATNVWIDDNQESEDWKSQHEAVRKDQTWGVPVYASVELVDRKSGKVLSTSKKMKIASLPKNTDYGSFIVKGKHYQVHNQLRRKPGIYVTEMKNRKLKTEINIAGRAFDISFNSENSTFRLMRGQADSTGVALYPILSRMGISDSMLAKTWGESILAANKAISAKKSKEAVVKAAKHFTSTDYDDADDAAKAIGEYFEEHELRPEVTKSTVGKAFSKLSPEAVVVGSKELLRAINGERGPDDRQALEYKRALGFADVFRERFIKPNGELTTKINEFRKKIHRKMNNQKAPPKKIDELLGVGQFTPALTGFFTQSSLSSIPDQYNPINMLNGMSKITVLGEGGVQDAQRVRAEERSVHPSQLGFIDPIHTPDSEKIGVVMTLPLGAKKKGEDLQTKVFDVRSKKARYVSPADVRGMVLGFPDQFKDGKFTSKRVKAIVNGKHEVVDAKTVDAVLDSPKQAFSIASNTIPFLDSAQGVRAQAATKMLEQAIPLLNREAPLVQVKIGNTTIENTIGDGFAIKANANGIVTKVTKNKITIKTEDGEVEQPIYNNIPLNNKSFLSADTKVNVGDEVKAGQVIADSNFTENGTLAIGTNMKVAYIPWKGYNFEDGIVLTESGAEKLTSEHMHHFETKSDKNTTLSLAKRVAWNGDLTLEQQGKMDKDGIVRKGAILTKKDPIFVGVRKNRLDPDYLLMKQLGGTFKPMKAYQETWNEDVEGEVVDVVKRGNSVKVFIKTREPAEIGDKITNRHGGKGIITKIIPDGEAPHTEDGTPIDVLLNPHGVVSRINPSQLLETAAGKIAELNGKPFVVDNFSEGSHVEQVSAALDKAGISDTETLYDPHTKEPLGQVLVGPQYILKLSKQATSQFSARSEGKYDINKSPMRGGDDGAKALDLITFYSMLAHGSRANLREMATFKATQNQPFWDWLSSGAKSGMVKPIPESTFAYKKFEAYLKATGVDVKRKGSKLVLQPMTDKEIGKLSNGEIKDPTFLKAKNLKEEKGGLMDPYITGGRLGGRWSHIELPEPIPNPMFKDPIRKLANLNKQQFMGLVRGELFVDPKTGEFAEEGVTSGTAMRVLLKKVDIEDQIKSWTDKAKNAKGEKGLDDANKHLKYLHALKKLGVRPEDAYIQTKIPVLPPKFRPIAELEEGKLSNPGINTLYRDVGLISNELKWQNSAPFIDDGIKAELRQKLFEGVEAVTGLGNPIAYYPEARRPKGIIQQLKGPPAKKGFFQYKVLRRQQNLVGRGTIIPEPKLGLDEVGLPAEMSWSIFEPFVMRRLVNQSGMSPVQASEEIKKRSPVAMSMLEAEMKSRPVMLNRAPSLHKFGIMAFKPKLTDGKAIKIPPLVVKGFNADFDGDTMTVHVPILPDAVKEAEKMLPSNNLYNPGTGQIMIKPQNEAALGLYLLSKDTAGKKKLQSVLPKKTAAKYSGTVLDKKNLSSLMKDLAEELPQHHGGVIDKLKEMGDEHTYRIGFTVGLKDLTPNIEGRNAIFADVQKKLSLLDTQTPGGRSKSVDLVAKANKRLDSAVARSLAKTPNNFSLMVDSGARGNMNQLKQIVSAPFMVDDHKGNPNPVPILNSFSEGLPFSSYWSTVYGARAAAVDKQLQTANPGAFNKDLMAASVTNVIASDDCGTTEGLTMRLFDKSGKFRPQDIEDRYLAKDVKLGGKVLASAGSPVTSSLLNLIRDKKVGDVSVRSPLTCKLPKGTCAKCYGLNEHGQNPSPGDNVGATSGQALSEPLTQMTMQTFHTGGISGTRGVVSGYEKIDKLFKMHKIVSGKAALSEVNGKVESIEDKTGGKSVVIGGKTHFIEKNLWDSKKVRIGGRVSKGDILSRGLVQPKELVKLRGMLEAQNYVAGQIQDAYEGQGVTLKRRAVETVIRSVGNTTKISDPGDSDYLYGEVAPWTAVNDFNDKVLGKMPVSKALGHAIKESIAGLKPGDIIDEKATVMLGRAGRDSVEVGNKPIRHEAFLSGIQRIPVLRDDWMGQMGYRDIADALVGGAATLSESDLHGYSPVPAFAYGAEFGVAPIGKKGTGVY